MNRQQWIALSISVLVVLSDVLTFTSAGVANSIPRIQDTNEQSQKSRSSTTGETSSKNQPTNSPIILIPGDGGSQLFAKLDKPDVVHYFCDRRTDAYFNLWLNMALLVPFVIDCWIDNMRLQYDNVTRKTSNSPGVEIMVPGFGNTTSVEYVDPSQVSVTGYYNTLVNYLVANGFTRGSDIRGAPYDFRKSPTELADYYKSLVTLVEETYRQQDYRKVILVCHSMGCPVTLYFLNHQSPVWKETYVKTLVTLAAPWGGAVKALKAFTSGDNLGVIVVPALTIRKDERTFPSLAYLMPSDKFWGHDEVLMSSGNKQYTTRNYQDLFRDIDYDVGYNMWLDTRNLTYDLRHPGVDVHCIHAVGIETMEHLEYKSEKFPDHNPKITFGDGDSTVNSRSLAGCLRWKEEPGRNFQYLNLTGVDHMSVMTDARILKHLLDLARSK